MRMLHYRVPLRSPCCWPNTTLSTGVTTTNTGALVPKSHTSFYSPKCPLARFYSYTERRSVCRQRLPWRLERNGPKTICRLNSRSNCKRHREWAAHNRQLTTTTQKKRNENPPACVCVCVRHSPRRVKSVRVCANVRGKISKMFMQIMRQMCANCVKS